MKKVLFILTAIMILSSCDTYTADITNGYWLLSIDEEDPWLVYRPPVDHANNITIIKPAVFGVGYNEDFIIVLQHPVDGYWDADTSISNYYIIPITHPIDESVRLNKIGPLTEVEFIRKRKDLGVPDSISFTITVDDIW